jgi:hypothetical protein
VNLRRGFQRITLVLAVVSAYLSAPTVVSEVFDKHKHANGILRSKKKDFIPKYSDIFESVVSEPTSKTFEAVLNIEKFRRKYPEYDNIPDTDLIPKLKKKYFVDKAEISELESGFWVNLSELGLTWLYIAAGLSAATIGFLLG